MYSCQQLNFVPVNNSPNALNFCQKFPQLKETFYAIRYGDLCNGFSYE